MEGLSQANVLHEVLYLQAHDNGFKKKIRYDLKSKNISAQNRQSTSTVGWEQYAGDQ